MPKKRNKWEDRRFRELQMQEKAKDISELEREPKFYLQSITGACIGVFKPDFKYKLLNDWMHLKAGTWVIEEFKGSEFQHSYTRRDYPLRRKHFMADFNKYVFIENINGKIKIPKPRYEKIKEDGYRYE